MRMTEELSKEEIKFPERVYVSTSSAHVGFGLGDYFFEEMHRDLNEAVSGNKETEVAIYQLVRVAKFKKTAVEYLRETPNVKV